MTSRRSFVAGLAALFAVGGSALPMKALPRGRRYSLKEGIILYFRGADLTHLCAVSGLHGTSMCGPSDNLDYENAWWELYRSNREFHAMIQQRFT
jgi:hypothetical protein